MPTFHYPRNLPPTPLKRGGGITFDVRHQMKNQDYRIFDSLSCGISRFRGDLAIFGMAARNISVASGVKLVQRIDARPLRSQGLNADVRQDRAVIQRLALVGNVLDTEPLLVKVEQAMAGQPA